LGPRAHGAIAAKKPFDQEGFRGYARHLTKHGERNACRRTPNSRTDHGDKAVKSLLSIIILAVVVAFTAPAFAEDAAPQPLTRADCNNAGLKWDEQGNVCSDKVHHSKEEKKQKKKMKKLKKLKHGKGKTDDHNKAKHDHEKHRHEKHKHHHHKDQHPQAI
jgi:hypothetical protein